ncbi:MAG: diaminopimelate epimerase [Clostridiales bacterium]|nr:diaminopimelate epimerase [Clostridiales bacterium]
MHLTKMQGLGNDYLFFYGTPADPSALAVRLSDRHFGIGSDGLILIEPSVIADFRMRIFNADGSEAMMCGNGIRCVGKYVYEKGCTDQTALMIETRAGIRSLQLEVSSGTVKSVAVDMGRAEVSAKETLTENIVFIPVSVGNSHAVIFVKDAENAPLTTVGPQLEKHARFPDSVNVEFVQLIDCETLRMRVWERGSGVTMACGTGACAAAAAAVHEGFCKEDEEISVQMDGGTLKVKVLPDRTVIMRGPAETICECEVAL